jgi:hypothetical protein
MTSLLYSFYGKLGDVHPIGTIGTVAELKEEHKGFDYPV